MNKLFDDRKDAGKSLATEIGHLSESEKKKTILLALPRGGVPIAHEVAQKLNLPFDVLLVRKIGHPLQPEYGIGAITEDGNYWLDPEASGVFELNSSQLEKLLEKEKTELERRKEIYRKNRVLPTLHGKIVIIIDDGLATGVTAKVAIRYAKSKQAEKVIFAAPVGSSRAVHELQKIADQVICPYESSLFFSVGQFYRNFDQVSDDEVIALLDQGAERSQNKIPPAPSVLKSRERSRREPASIGKPQEILVPNSDGTETRGFLNLPSPLFGIIIFAHGSGSGRLSVRNQQVAHRLNLDGFGTLLFDLLTDAESQNRVNVFDIPLLAKRLISATNWIRQQTFAVDIPLAYFGASTGAGAALWAAAEMKNEIAAVVSRGGRPDLALSKLREVVAPTLLIVGDKDKPVVPLNELSLKYLKNGKLVLVPNATHLFEEPGTLEQVSELAAQWFEKHLQKTVLLEQGQISTSSITVSEAIVKAAVVIKNRKDILSLIGRLSKAKIVMLGESTHGTQEFYEYRKFISEELIANYGFNFIAVEGDWPPCSELNRFIQAESRLKDVRTVLKHFHRWPTWMWANSEIMDLSLWLKTHNENRPKDLKAGFFGLDVYSLFESMDEVLKNLKKVDPALANRVRTHYECFDPFQRDEKAYVKSLIYFPEGCEHQVVDVLKDLLKNRYHQWNVKDELLFDAQQNARVVKNAEQYYRTMIQADDNSWNIRDRHMLETLENLLVQYGPDSKGIVWAHNTHIGDYRATTMAHEGLVNIGGLAREKWGPDKVYLLGFGTFEGKVIAAHAWDGPAEVMPVPAGREQSHEAHFHGAAEKLGENIIYVNLNTDFSQAHFSELCGQRAIGVVYDPAHERHRNYVPTFLSKRYDGFMFFDKTTAITPLPQKFERKELPDTWPQGT